MHKYEIEIHHADGTKETISRVIQNAARWQWARYKGQRFQVFGGIRGPFFINPARPILAR